jgi:hypothetical protein
MFDLRFKQKINVIIVSESKSESNFIRIRPKLSDSFGFAILELTHIQRLMGLSQENFGEMRLWVVNLGTN